MHLELGPVTQPMSEEYVALTVVLSVLFISVAGVGAYFMYKWYRIKQRRKRHQRTKDYKDVTTCSVSV